MKKVNCIFCISAPFSPSILNCRCCWPNNTAMTPFSCFVFYSFFSFYLFLLGSIASSSLVGWQAGWLLALISHLSISHAIVIKIEYHHYHWEFITSNAGGGNKSLSFFSSAANLAFLLWWWWGHLNMQLFVLFCVFWIYNCQTEKRWRERNCVLKKSFWNLVQTFAVVCLLIDDKNNNFVSILNQLFQLDH